MICKACGIDKPTSEFKIRSDNGNLRKRCHECHTKVRTATRSTWTEKHKDRRRNLQLRHKYGITLVDYNEMFMKQEGKCAICFIHQTELPTKLHVDHNHATGKVRGLLCVNCNHALGSIKENEQSILNMLTYLKIHGE